MRKTIPYLFLLLALVLSACGSLTPPTAAAPTSPTTAVEQPAATQAQEQAGALAAAAAPTTAAEPACRVDTNSQSVEALESQFPNVGTTDWTRGPDGAYVHVIEYSDFQ